jgi:hypothetical protein
MIGRLRIVNLKGKEKKPRGVSKHIYRGFSPTDSNYERYHINMSPAEYSNLGLPESELVYTVEAAYYDHFGTRAF